MRGVRGSDGERPSSAAWRGTDRAVSETISFILVFSLVVASVGTIYAVGVSELEQTRDAERIENAERAFDVLADNLRDVLDGAPSRGTEVRLADATVSSVDDATMNVTIDPDSGPAPDPLPIRLRPLVYEAAAGGEIRLSNGAVLRDSARGEASVVRGPPLIVDGGDRVRLTLIKQEHVGTTAVGGSQTVRIRAAASRPRLFYDAEGGHNISVNLTTPYTDAWARQYESAGFDNCTEVTEPTAGSPGKLSCNVSDVDRVTVVWVRVTTSFE
ncbi:hypothetical protein D3D02_05420 [Halobellus sp. Atlit-38R]|uniref:DUF7289 family protein n=1 Tax=Halobellus sp. Atlit-38R TaxID=2282131 RepID=UPI000EF25C85|nr:hypothetical protein [Halobellus sp. Atlit-38R]RLM90208.1 hypothetical protein D3D02_05420 [Halobellus sp. Atlit-38R]